tara:strand:+ start:3850 stop:4803 length:954 start_codon:yes stop_codon:yes gene_type:complete
MISKKKILAGIFSFLIGMAIIILIIILSGVNEFINIVKNISPLWMVFSALIFLVGYLFRALRLRHYTRLKISDLFSIVIMGYALNALLPVKIGDVGMVTLLKRKGVELKRGISAIVHCRILDLISIVLIVIPLSFFYTNESINITSGVSKVIIFLAIFFILLISLRIKIVKKLINGIEEKISRKIFRKIFRSGVDQIKDYKKIVMKNKRLTLLYSLISWIIEGLVVYTVSIGLNQKIPFFILLLAVTVANISKIIPATPGGIGLYEGSMVIFLNAFGVPVSAAAGIAIVEHALKNIITILGGGIVILKNNILKEVKI